MHSHVLQRITGGLFILAVIAFGITSSILSASFNWPDILRESPDSILTSFREGGSTLIWTWLGVAWSYLLLLVPVFLLRPVLQREDTPYLEAATFIGAVAVVASLIGFLRWVFVVPGLAETYADPSAAGTTREAVVAAFQAQHQFGGALLGEHVGQALSVVWTLMVSVAMLRSPVVRPWVGLLGIAASLVYFLNQGDMLATVVPGFPVWEPAGLVGSMAWALWLLVLGVSLVGLPRRERAIRPRTSELVPRM